MTNWGLMILYLLKKPMYHKLSWFFHCLQKLSYNNLKKIFDNKKLDLILQKLEVIEEHLGLKSKPKTIYDDMEIGYSVKDTAKILGCGIQKVRDLQNIGSLKSYMLGRQKMITSESIRNVVSTLSGKKV